MGTRLARCFRISDNSVLDSGNRGFRRALINEAVMTEGTEPSRSNLDANPTMVKMDWNEV